jgi:hypothetical protein
MILKLTLYFSILSDFTVCVCVYMCIYIYIYIYMYIYAENRDLWKSHV